MKRSRSRILLSALMAVLLSTVAFGQFSLTTMFAGQNGQAGNMFDVMSPTGLTITDFDVNLDIGVWDIEIYSVDFDPTAVNAGSIAQTPTAGPSIGLRADMDPAQWTLVTTIMGVTGNGPGMATNLNAGVAIPLAPGQRQGLYVTVTNGGAINYTNGSNWGGVAASDTFLNIYEGWGNAYPFTSSFGFGSDPMNPGGTSRIWNGTIYYSPNQSNITTTFMDNNGQAGNMFDVMSPTGITVTDFDVNLDIGVWNIEIYIVNVDPTAMNPGSIAQTPTTGPSAGLRADTDPTQWTLVTTITGVMGNGPGTATNLNAGVTIQLAPGQRQGLYVTVTNGGAINYTNGANWGGVIASDANLSIYEGWGKLYPFANSFGSGSDPMSPGGTSRIWNGTIYYSAVPSNPIAGSGQAPQLGLAVLDINGATEANGIVVGGLDPNTMAPINGPFFTNVSQGTSIDLHFEGAAGQPILLLGGPLNVGVTSFSGIGQLDLGGPLGMNGIPSGLLLLADGTENTFPDVLYRLDVDGEVDFSFGLGSNFPLGVLTTLQAIMFTGGPSVIAISNAVEVTVVP